MLGERVRRPGAGPKRRIDVGPELLVLLDSLVEPESRGHPMSPLRWTLKSTRVLAAELGRLGHRPERTRWGICCTTSGTASRPTPKVAEGKQHPDRDGQFRYINETAGEHLAAGQPVISVDCKKKELVGDYANGGKEWEPQGEPTRVGVHGWERMGKARYPDATHLMITADAAILDAVGVDVWLPALGRDREPRDDGAVVAELTSLIDDPKLPPAPPDRSPRTVTRRSENDGLIWPHFGGVATV